MSQSTIPAGPSSTAQFRLIALLSIPVLALLAFVYFAFLRTDYAVLASDLRPDEAGAIVQQLKKEDIGYKLSASGSTILVPDGQADELRLSIVAGGLADPGSVGFELFNETDMGLTDFAQKVNYQRALQGELARTIMGMDGIAFARVHLALPERSLFRQNRSEPSAAVTVVPKPNVALDGARIAGIQRLVASTVTDLRVENVAVLNQRGQLVTLDPEVTSPGRMANASPLERAYAERLERAIRAIAPELSFELKVTTVPLATGAFTGRRLPAPDRDHAIRVVMFTGALVAPEQQADLTRIMGQVIGANRDLGDDIQFSVMPPISTAPPVDEAVPVLERKPSGADNGNLLPEWWFETSLALGLALCLGTMFLIANRRRAARREQLYFRIRDQLRLEPA